MQQAIKAAVLAATIATPAVGQQNCADRGRLMVQLADQYGETRQTIGMAGSGVIEQFANAATGTWTLTITRPSGVMCIIGAGQNFERVDHDPAPMGEPM